MSIARHAAILFAAAALLPAAALAADYEPPVYVEPAEEYVPVEVGSGWYLRGDIGYAFDTGYDDADIAVEGDFTVFDPFFPFNRTGYDHDDPSILGSIGFGYHFNDYLRGDLNVGIIERDTIEADGVAFGCVGFGCGVGVTVDRTSWTGVANAYVDLGTYAGFTPYLGAGLGILHSKLEVTGFTPDLVAEASDSGTYFLYTLNAGAAYKLTENTSVDLGYQYMSAPDAPYIEVNPGSLRIGEGIDQHQIRLGLRYDLW